MKSPTHWFYLLFTGTIGHVAHGKSTVVKAISGVQVSEISSKLFQVEHVNLKKLVLINFSAVTS